MIFSSSSHISFPCNREWAVWYFQCFESKQSSFLSHIFPCKFVKQFSVAAVKVMYQGCKSLTCSMFHSVGVWALTRLFCFVLLCFEDMVSLCNCPPTLYLLTIAFSVLGLWMCTTKPGCTVPLMMGQRFWSASPYFSFRVVSGLIYSLECSDSWVFPLLLPLSCGKFWCFWA